MIDDSLHGYYHNIFLTGAPKSGKSTLLKSLISSVPQKIGFLTQQLLDMSGRRTGFELVDQSGTTYPFASRVQNGQYIHNFQNKYWIDPQGLADIISRFSAATGDLVYVDEVAPMALYLKSFFPFVSSLLNSPALVLGVTKLDDKEYPTIQALKKRSDTLIIDITRFPESEDFLRNLMKKVVKSQLYLADDSLRTKTGEGTWQLSSSSATRKLLIDRFCISCSCDFFSRYGICSHTIALRQKIF